ncbi:uncharacterized protein BN801_00322 [Mycoplasma sp. CAG:877]|nr:uncharacterized protein BN801_00322 [Mycoplasma sp. CAG:877]
METLMKKFFRSSLISSIILMIIGVLLILQSEITIITISYLIGTLLIAMGAIAIIKFIKNINNVAREELDIFYGVVTIILGVIVVYNPEAIASIIPIIIGIGIIINSATKLQYALELRESLNNQWKTTVVISIISAVCGVILICNPFKGAVVIMQIIGGFIVAYSILDIVSTITIKKNVAAIHNAIDGNINDAEVVDEENVETNQTEESKKTEKKDKKSKKKNKKGNTNAE